MFLPIPQHAVIPTLPPHAQLHVLAIGVGRFQSAQLTPLQFVAQDATKLVRTLGQLAGNSYRQVDLQALVDEEASAQAIQTKLRELRGRVQPDDVTILYLAGHGLHDLADGSFCFATYDVDQGRARETGLPASLIARLLWQLPSRRLLIADVCSAGALNESAEATPGGLQQTLLQQVGSTSRHKLTATAGPRTFAILMASAKNCPALEARKFEGGVFTRALIEGLRGEGDNGLGSVTLRSLCGYTRTRVEVLTLGQQQPCFAVAEGDPDFVLISQPAPSLPVRSEDPLIGSQIAGYQITSRIEQAVRHVLYSGVSLKDLSVAVQMRVLSLELSRKPAEAKRFLSASQLLREAKLPGFTVVYELGWLKDGRCHVVVGTSGLRRLRDVLACGPLPPDAAWALLYATAQALQQAHQRQLVYASLTPNRVLLDADLRRFLLAEGEHMMRLGTPSTLSLRPASEPIADCMDAMYYQAPETRRPDAELTEAVDVYSLAAVACHVLLGQPPFAGDTVSQLDQAQRASPGLLDAASAPLPPGAADLLRQMLAPDPGRRPDLLRVLREFQVWQRVAPAPASTSVRPADSRTLDARTVHANKTDATLGDSVGGDPLTVEPELLEPELLEPELLVPVPVEPVMVAEPPAIPASPRVEPAYLPLPPTERIEQQTVRLPRERLYSATTLLQSPPALPLPESLSPVSPRLMPRRAAPQQELARLLPFAVSLGVVLMTILALAWSQFSHS